MRASQYCSVLYRLFVVGSIEYNHLVTLAKRLEAGNVEQLSLHFDPLPPNGNNEDGVWGRSSGR